MKSVNFKWFIIYVLARNSVSEFIELPVINNVYIIWIIKLIKKMLWVYDYMNAFHF